MQLVTEWRSILKKAWSIRLILASTVLCGADFVLGLVLPDHPPIWLVAFAGLLNIGAAISRIVWQPKMNLAIAAEEAAPSAVGDITTIAVANVEPK